MRHGFLTFAALVALSGCGASVGVGYNTIDPWLRPDIPRDPPRPDWLQDIERQYREHLDNQQGRQ